MTTPLTLSELPALRALAEKATPGPWRTMECSYGGLILLRDQDDGRHIQSHLQIVPASDAAFIAAARDALPRACATIEAQAKEIAERDAEIARLREAAREAASLLKAHVGPDDKIAAAVLDLCDAALAKEPRRERREPQRRTNSEDHMADNTAIEWTEAP